MNDQELLDTLDQQLSNTIECSLSHCTADAQYRVECKCPDCGHSTATLVCGDCFQGMTRCMSYICYGCDTAMPFNRVLKSRLPIYIILEDR